MGIKKLEFRPTGTYGCQLQARAKPTLLCCQSDIILSKLTQG